MTDVSLKDVSLKDVSLKDVSLKDVRCIQSLINFANFLLGSSRAEEFADTQILHSLAICITFEPSQNVL